MVLTVTRSLKSVLAYFAASLACPIFFAAVRPPSFRAFANRVSHATLGSLLYPPALARSYNLPRVIFWAWERPEDFRFLSPDQAGVAFLAKTIYLDYPSGPSSANPSPSFLVRPRLQPLRVNSDTPIIAVVRIIASRGTPPAAFFKSTASDVRWSQAPPDYSSSGLSSDFRSSPLLRRVASEISDLQRLPGVSAIQIDFDATVSERPLYAALLTMVRRNLPPTMPLSITALASWCIGDPWLENLPPGTIDEAVPMLFRLGPDAADVVDFLHSGNDFSIPPCRTSLGLSNDEPLSRQLLAGHFPAAHSSWRQKRIYVFSPRAWTRSTAQSLLEESHP